MADDYFVKVVTGDEDGGEEACEACDQKERATLN